MRQLHRVTVAGVSVAWCDCYTCVNCMVRLLHMRQLHGATVTHASITWCDCYTCVNCMVRLLHMWDSCHVFCLFPFFGIAFGEGLFVDVVLAAAASVVGVVESSTANCCSLLQT